MQRSEISLPGDWPHLQTTSCFAHVVRHCLDTLHLACVFFDESVSQNTPKPKNLRTGTVACSLREATELFKLRFQKESHSTNVFIKGFISFQLCRECANPKCHGRSHSPGLDTVGCCGLSSTKEALRSTRP